MPRELLATIIKTSPASNEAKGRNGYFRLARLNVWETSEPPWSKEGRAAVMYPERIAVDMDSLTGIASARIVLEPQAALLLASAIIQTVGPMDVAEAKTLDQAYLDAAHRHIETFG